MIHSEKPTTRLLSTEEIERVQNLLWEIYCEEFKWTPNSDNPSGVECIDSKKTNQRLGL